MPSCPDLQGFRGLSTQVLTLAFKMLSTLSHLFSLFLLLRLSPHSAPAPLASYVIPEHVTDIDGPDSR